MLIMLSLVPISVNILSAHSHVFITDDRNLKQPQQER